MSGLLELREITRTFTVPDSEPLHILTGVNLSVSPGEHVAIVGRSGTGKSTLLNILGLIDKNHPKAMGPPVANRRILLQEYPGLR